jgi:integrase
LGKAIAAAGLSKPGQRLPMRVSPLGLRLACASQALAQGMPVAEATQWLGHAHARTTARYKGGGTVPPPAHP